MSPRTCTHCGIILGPGKRHGELPDGSPCPNKGRRSGTQIPWRSRPEHARGNPKVRLEKKWGALCSLVQAEQLTEEASLLLLELLRKHGRGRQES